MDGIMVGLDRISSGRGICWLGWVWMGFREELGRGCMGCMW